mgnify:CR=1 FL=1
MTLDGRLLPESFEALWRLRDAGIRVVPVTGRPAGWCDLIARTWPVDGVIGENGGLYYWLIPLFAISNSLDYFIYFSTGGHVLWTAYIMWKSYRYRCEVPGYVC